MSDQNEYILLRPNDIVKKSDEFLADDCQTWKNVGEYGASFMVGMKYNYYGFQPIRRKIYPLNNENN